MLAQEANAVKGELTKSHTKVNQIIADEKKYSGKRYEPLEPPPMIKLFFQQIAARKKKKAMNAN